MGVTARSEIHVDHTVGHSSPTIRPPLMVVALYMGHIYQLHCSCLGGPLCLARGTAQRARWSLLRRVSHQGSVMGQNLASHTKALHQLLATAQHHMRAGPASPEGSGGVYAFSQSKTDVQEESSTL
jgi:hypothetical protein